jgi:predicted GIY-YIG superfamily endonuclease
MQCSETRLFKVGITHDIASRLASIQSANPFEVNLIDSCQWLTKGEALSLEKQIHKYLKNQKSHVMGEWFELTKQLEQKIRHKFFAYQEAQQIWASDCTGIMARELESTHPFWANFYNTDGYEVWELK